MRFALVLQSPGVDAGWLRECTLAIAVQLQRDAAPTWDLAPPEVDATIYSSFEAVPAAALPIVLLPDADVAGDLGYHTETKDGRPYARVFTSGQDADGISTTISHEAIEALIDPACNRWVQSPTGLVFALEAADMVEDQSYEVEGIAVSNFVLPAWCDGGTAQGSRVDFLGKLARPWEISPGGYALVLQADGTTKTIPAAAAARREKRHPASRSARRGLRW